MKNFCQFVQLSNGSTLSRPEQLPRKSRFDNKMPSQITVNKLNCVNQSASSSLADAIQFERQLQVPINECIRETSTNKIGKQLDNEHSIVMMNRSLYQVSSGFKLNLALISVGLLIVMILTATIECHNLKRTQYHEQGVHGPKSYKFGFTAGDHKNPQERHEVSDGYGHVKGWYSFVDANGKYQVVHYEAHPKYGFKVYNHKSKAYNNGKRHYNT